LSVAVDICSKPYRAQGAAMTLEDGAVLGNLLSRISHISQLGPLLKAYQDLRLPRTAEMQASSRLNQQIYHLQDGPEQRKRDEDMKKAMTLQLSGKSSTWNQNQSAGGVGNDVIFGYDADLEVEKWWAAHGEELEALARVKS